MKAVNPANDSGEAAGDDATIRVTVRRPKVVAQGAPALSAAGSAPPLAPALAERSPDNPQLLDEAEDTNNKPLRPALRRDKIKGDVASSPQATTIAVKPEEAAAQNPRTEPVQDKTMSEEESIDRLVSEGRYFVPIAQVTRRRQRQLLVVILVLVGLAALMYAGYILKIAPLKLPL